ncbi:MAG: M50 family metallopeptidase [Candidatus Taylorbacteria bacterium]
MNLGIILLCIVILAYVSNWLNWKFLNYKITHYLYYIGAFVHESSHALLCILTGAKVEEFKVFTSQPHVIHGKSRLPIIGGFLISIAPIGGGLLFLYLINHILLGNYITLIPFTHSIQDIAGTFLSILSQLHIFDWRTWVFVLLLVNVGAMLGPSIQDIKNIWFIFILTFFIHIPILETIGIGALYLISLEIGIQIVCIAIVMITKKVRILIIGHSAHISVQK